MASGARDGMLVALSLEHMPMTSTRRSRWLGPVMFMLAIGPTAFAVVAMLVHWLTQPAWRLDEPLWGLVAAQVLAIGAYSAHAISNPVVIEDDAVGNWVWQFIVLQPFGMLGYWWKYL